MKLITIMDVFKKEMSECEPAISDPLEEWNLTMSRLCKDIKRYHTERNFPPNKACSEELCGWCYYKAIIIDTLIPFEKLACIVGRKNGKDVSCADCIRPTMWYKRLI